MSQNALKDIEFEKIPAHAPVPKTETRRKPRLLRLAAYGGVMLAAAALAVLGGWWALFRYEHVVSVDARLSGNVANVGARFDGVVASIKVKAGQRVYSGEVLAQLDDRHLKEALRRAQAELEHATQRLKVERLAIPQDESELDARLSEAQSRLDASKARVTAAESAATQAKHKYGRISELHRKGVSSEDELNAAETAMRVTSAEADSAKAEREVAEAGKLSAEIEQKGLNLLTEKLALYESQVEAARAEVGVARADLDASVIRAPDDGWIAQRIVEPGGSVRVGQPVLSLWIGRLWVEAWIYESDLPQVSVGDRATVTIDTYSGMTSAGHVDSLGVLANVELPTSYQPQIRRSRTDDAALVSVRVELDQVPDGLFPGLSATVSFPKREPGFFAPTAAILQTSVSQDGV